MMEGTGVGGVGHFGIRPAVTDSWVAKDFFFIDTYRFIKFYIHIYKLTCQTRYVLE